MLESSLTLYKLIVLYLLKKVNFPLTNAQISEFILEQGYTTYFHLQEAFHELVDSHLISTETRRNTTYYNLTVDGENTLNYFSNLIPDVIRQEADSYLKENKYELRNEFATRGLSGALRGAGKQRPPDRSVPDCPHGGGCPGHRQPLEEKKSGHLRLPDEGAAVIL